MNSTKQPLQNNQLSMKDCRHLCLAFDYLVSWFQNGKKWHDDLRPSSKVAPEEKRETLVKIANAYQVSRNFPKAPDGGDSGPRLKEASKLLEKQKGPITPDNRSGKVKALADKLGEKYPKNGKDQDLVSAASKFLWYKHRDPVIIYDNRAKNALYKLCKCSDNKLVERTKTGTGLGDYGKYCCAWDEAYKEYEKEVVETCCHLVRCLSDHKPLTESNLEIEIKTLDEIKEVIDSKWFRHRLFDKFLFDLGE